MAIRAPITQVVISEVERQIFPPWWWTDLRPHVINQKLSSTSAWHTTGYWRRGSSPPSPHASRRRDDPPSHHKLSSLPSPNEPPFRPVSPIEWPPLPYNKRTQSECPFLDLSSAYSGPIGLLTSVSRLQAAAATGGCRILLSLS